MSHVNDEFQLFPELTGFMSTTFTMREATSPRLYMYFGQLSQSCITHGVTPRRLYTGIDDKYGDFVFNVKAEHNCEVIAVITKMAPKLNDKAQYQPPLVLAIVRRMDMDIPYYDVIEVTRYHCLHQHYGVKFSPQNAHLINAGKHIAAGTVIAGPSCRLPDGTYMYGTETLLAYMSIPEVTEDGGKVSAEWLQTQTADCYGKAIIQFNEEDLPLNLYGDDEDYRIIPGIGETVRSDGLLFAKRKVSKHLAGIQLHPKRLRKTEQTDMPVYVPPGSEIMNVTVFKSSESNMAIPELMTTQMNDYISRTLAFCDDLLRVERNLKQQYNKAHTISPRLHNIFKEAHAYIACMRNGKYIDVVYSKVGVKGYTAVVEYHYKMVPTRGAKFTNSNGAKWIVVSIAPRADMPYDPLTGLTADVILDPNGTVRRTITGQVTEQYLGASILNMERRFKEEYYGVGKEVAYETLKQYIGIVSPPMLELINDPRHDINHFWNTVKHNNLRMYIPANNPVRYPEVILELERRWPVPFGQLTYRAWSGEMVTTKQRILIGPMYMYALDKDGREFSAVASANLQSNFGTPAKLAGSAKYAAPIKLQPVKFLGASEARLLAAACGGQVVAEMIERSNNPIAHKAEAVTLLTHPSPSCIDKTVDFSKIPITGGRIVQFTEHLLSCQGVTISHSKEDIE